MRDYGTAKWEGGDAVCDHVEMKVGMSDKNTLGPDGYLPPNNAANKGRLRQFKSECARCGARRIDSQIGLETTYQEFVEQMVAVFREVRRVLRKDGTLWLNLGDSYGAQTGQQKIANSAVSVRGGGHKIGSVNYDLKRETGLKPKDLCGIPWRVAFALQADGWCLRQDIIWSKPNPMPESVTDRCTKAHEYLFLLSKSARYYYDAEAIKEAVSGGSHPSGPNGKGQKLGIPGSGIKNNDSFGPAIRNATPDDMPTSRNRRSVWEIATAPFSEAHFATFPPALIEPCILAGTSAKGCCAKCGAPWVRMTEAEYSKPRGESVIGGEKGLDKTNGWSGYPVLSKKTNTTGWHPTCLCVGDHPNIGVVPCTVLDPFGGAGTTGLVADRLQRDAILIELNPAYAEMARNRIVGDAPLFVSAAE